jgi:hypothetical protein
MRSSKPIIRTSAAMDARRHMTGVFMTGKPLHVLVGAAGLALAACTHVVPSAKEASMTTNSTTDSIRMMPVREWPLRFDRHSFSVHCYDTYGCKVVYAGMVQRDDAPNELRPSSAGYGRDYSRGWGGGHAMIRNFPPPAVVTWKSRDGQAHRAEVDVGKIFQDEVIRHNVTRAEMAELPDGKYESEPAVVIEVNDRSVRVYMRAMIFLKQQRLIAGHLRSEFRNDLILVESYDF